VTRLFLAGPVLVALLAASPAAAQFRLDLDPGARVRVTTAAAPEERVVGRVVRVGADSLLITPHGAPAGAATGYALSDVAVLEVRGGHDRKHGALLVGGGFTAISAVAGGIDRGRDRISSSDLALTIVGNAVFGALIGAAFGPAGWRKLPLPGRTATVQAPAR